MYESIALNINGSGDGTASAVDQLTDKWVFFRGLSTGTANLQTSVDGTNFFTVKAQTAAGWVELPQPCTHVRLNGSGLTLTAATLRGFNRNKM